MAKAKTQNLEAPLVPLLISKKQVLVLLGGSHVVLKRMRKAGWVKPVSGEGHGRCLFRYKDITDGIDRLGSGELPK